MGVLSDERVTSAGNDLAGDAVRAATGSMIAYVGDVAFRNVGMGGGGLRAALERKATGESVALMTCTGRGTVWFAEDAMHVIVISPAGDTLEVESEQLLALSDSLRTDVAFAGGPVSWAGRWACCPGPSRARSASSTSPAPAPCCCRAVRTRCRTLTCFRQLEGQLVTLGAPGLSHLQQVIQQRLGVQQR